MSSLRKLDHLYSLSSANMPVKKSKNLEECGNIVHVNDLNTFMPVFAVCCQDTGSFHIPWFSSLLIEEVQHREKGNIFPESKWSCGVGFFQVHQIPGENGGVPLYSGMRFLETGFAELLGKCGLELWWWIGRQWQKLQNLVSTFRCRGHERVSQNLQEHNSTCIMYNTTIIWCHNQRPNMGNFN